MCIRDRVYSSPSSSVTVSTSPQPVQLPPSPMRRANSWQSGQRPGGDTLAAFSDLARAVLAHQGDGLSTATRSRSSVRVDNPVRTAMASVVRPVRSRRVRASSRAARSPTPRSRTVTSAGRYCAVVERVGAGVRSSAAAARTAATGSPTAQYLPADVTVRERGVGERAARLEALTRLLRTGLTTEAIAVRTGLSTRTLDRLRVAVDNPSP